MAKNAVHSQLEAAMLAQDEAAFIRAASQPITPPLSSFSFVMLCDRVGLWIWGHDHFASKILPHRQNALLRAWMGIANPRNPSHAGALLGQFIAHDRMDLVEEMIGHGFVGVQAHHEMQQSISSALAKGHWPCIEHFLPTVLQESGFAEMLICGVAVQVGFGPTCGFFDPKLAKRVLGLEIQDKTAFCELFNTKLAQAFLKHPQVGPDAAIGLALYHNAGLLDLSKVDKPTICQEAASLLRQAQTHASALEMERDVPKAQETRASSLRL